MKNSSPKLIILGSLAIVSIIGLIYNHYKKREGFEINLQYSPDKDVSDLVKNAEIPLNIFQTWHTKNLPPKMRHYVDKLISDNPEFTHYLYDDNDCREFIEKFFPPTVLDAYDRLIPGAYKADLWRCCVLYIHGGIYLDIKYQCVKGFKLIALTEKEYYVRDRKFDEVGIYNALMVCKAKSDIMMNCIRKIVENVDKKFYGKNPLQPTGPQLVNKFFTPTEIQNLELALDVTGEFINYKRGLKEFHILYIYPEYRAEQRLMAKTKYYAELWHARNIYTF